MRTIVQLLFLFFFPFYGIKSQPADPVADSLFAVLKKAKEDTAKVNLLLEIGYTVGSYDTHKALSYVQQGFDLGKKLNFTEGMGKTAYLLSDIYLNLGDYTKSKAMLDEAENIFAPANNMEMLGKINNARGNWYYMQSDMWNASFHYSKAAEIFHNLKDTVREIIPYQNLISSLGETKSYEKAISLSKKLLETLETRKDSLRMAHAYHQLIINNLALNNFTEAYRYIPRLLSYIQKTLDYNLAAESYNVIGKYYVSQEQYDTAIGYYNQALEKALKDNYQTSLYNLSIGEAYLKKGQPSTAFAYLVAAETQAKKANSPDIVYRISRQLSDYYKKNNDYKKAYEYLQEYTKLNDSFLVAETRQYAAQLEAVYENNKKETEILRLKTEELNNSMAIRRRNNYLFLAAGVLLLLGLTFALQLRNQKNKRKLFEQDKQLRDEKIVSLEKQQQVISLQSMITGQETERNRIAKDLHDGLGGLFSTVKMYFSSLQHENPGLASDPLFTKSFELADTASVELRRIAHNLMPEVLMKLGLINAIRDLCNNINIGRLLTISLQSYGMEERLKSSMEIMLYRIIQELLNNIIRHAQATEVIIQFNKHSDQLTITIEDNGRGFNVADADEAGHAGIGTVKSRVNYLNGRLSIDSREGVGTTVLMEFLLNNTEPV